MSYKEEWIELYSLFLNWNISLYVLVSLQLCSCLCIWIVRSQHYIQCYCNHWNLGMHVKLLNENIQNTKKKEIIFPSFVSLQNCSSYQGKWHIFITYDNSICQQRYPKRFNVRTYDNMQYSALEKTTYFPQISLHFCSIFKISNFNIFDIRKAIWV